jgi:hypothetical protein
MKNVMKAIAVSLAGFLILAGAVSTAEARYVGRPVARHAVAHGVHRHYAHHGVHRHYGYYGDVRDSMEAFALIQECSSVP